jgi:hypothetical protein
VAFVISAEEYTWFLTHAILHDKACLRKLIKFDVSFVLDAAVTQVTVATIYVAYVLERFGDGFEYHSGHAVAYRGGGLGCSMGAAAPPPPRAYAGKGAG